MPFCRPSPSACVRRVSVIFLFLSYAPGRNEGAALLGGGRDPAVGGIEAGGSGRPARAVGVQEAGPPSVGGGALLELDRRRRRCRWSSFVSGPRSRRNVHLPLLLFATRIAPGASFMSIYEVVFFVQSFNPLLFGE